MAPAPTVGVLTIDEALARWRDEMTARGLKAKSIKTFVTVVRSVADAAGWRSPADMRLTDATAYIAARKRGEHGGRPWGGAACNVTASALRTFGVFCVAAGLVAADPFVHLRNGRKVQPIGARSLTVAEARSLMAASIKRHWGSKYGRGCPPLFYAVCMLTGLRHAEAASLTWACMDLDSATPGLWTDPAWSKSSRRDYVAIPDQLAGPLRELRAVAGTSKVFPVVPYPKILSVDMEAAQIRGNPMAGYASFHSLRKSYKTWLGVEGIAPKVVDYLARHKSASMDAEYMRPTREDCRAAVERLPTIFPQGGRKWWLPKSVDLTPDRADGTFQQADRDEHSPAHPDHPTPGRCGHSVSQSTASGRGSLGQGAHGPPPPRGHFDQLTLISGSDSDLETEVIRALVGWMARRNGPERSDRVQPR